MPPNILPRSFYSRNTVQVALDLLGKLLVRTINGRALSGVICETEAYGHADDPASHAHRRRTARNEAMFCQTGRAYVYFTYGMHHCFNVVARAAEAEAGAVLIRGIVPTAGVDAMVQNRGRDRNIADGPAKLAQALCITTQQYGEDLTIPGSIHIEDTGYATPKVRRSPRVGVKDERLWNFSI